MPVLKDISFTFESGKKYAVVGGSGSGKSTLLKLRMSYYGNYEGTITYGGQELRTLDKGSLYANAAMIQQRVVLFEDSIKDNITMYSKRTDEAVRRVADEAGLGALIAEEEEGIHGKVAENGQNFSGGEQQRFAIARAFIRNTPVLYLDEATASLDNQTSSQIENLLLSKKELTAVVVTHKLNAEILRRYDTVLVLKNGKIEESGSFDELMDRRKYFYGRYQVNQ